VKPAGQRFRVMPDLFAVCRLGPQSAVPEWATGPFVSVTRTEDELSIVCAADRLPAGVEADHGWRLLKIIGPFSFATTGVIASLAAPLAMAGISVLTIATYETDYLLVKNEVLDGALKALTTAGHVNIG
jgi:hypothetical protein